LTGLGADRGAVLLARLRPLYRWRYAVLTLLAIGAALKVVLPPGHDDWDGFFVFGSQMLFGHHPPGIEEAGGLHIYANYPDVQIGPLTLALVALFRVIWDDHGSRAAAIVLMTAAGPGLVYLLESTARLLWADNGLAFRHFTVLFGGGVVVFAWAELAAYYVHFDDGLTLLLACFAMAGVVRGRPLAVGVAIGLAAAAKPWGIVLLPLALSFRGRARFRASASALSVIAMSWLPFIVADHRTLSAGKGIVRTSTRSVLFLFGSPAGGSPGWVRPSQLGIALLLGTALALRGRWLAILLVSVAVRVVLDPAVFEYYSTGLIVAAFAWELLRTSRPLPVLTMGLFWLLLLADLDLHADRAAAILRLIACAGAIGLGIFSSSHKSDPRVGGLTR
jgi:hypothetical protein